jgi:hypothetical protein
MMDASAVARCLVYPLAAVLPRRAAMSVVRKGLAGYIDDDRDRIIAVLCDFVRATSPNRPGGTALTAALLSGFLKANGLPYRVTSPEPTVRALPSFDSLSGEPR